MYMYSALGRCLGRSTALNDYGGEGAKDEVGTGENWAPVPTGSVVRHRAVDGVKELGRRDIPGYGR